MIKVILVKRNPKSFFFLRAVVTARASYHFLEQFLFLLKVRVDKWEGVDEKSTKSDLRRRACSQKSDVHHINSFMYFCL